jgi:predicted N-acetyltransferase YhbS
MQITEFDPKQSKEVVDLFANVFGDSEGPAEGETIGTLVQNLISTTATDELCGYCTLDEGVIIGCIFFSRLGLEPGSEGRSVDDKAAQAELLSPVAVHTKYQRRGVGQQLILHGLESMKARGADLVFTYGDPAYYTKVGFRQISVDFIEAPYSLTWPEGWMAQSLQGNEMPSVKVSRCVEAFRDESYW